MPTLGRIRATRQDDCPTRCGPHPDHGNGLAGEPRLGPSVTLAPVWGVPSSQAASLWRSERNLAMPVGWNRTLKEQAIYGRVFQNLADVRAAVAEFVERYNQCWRLEKLAYQTPLEAREEYELRHAA